jgi:hypothetical protein
MRQTPHVGNGIPANKPSETQSAWDVVSVWRADGKTGMLQVILKRTAPFFFGRLVPLALQHQSSLLGCFEKPCSFFVAVHFEIGRAVVGMEGVRCAAKRDRG